ncbi:hypothetical protein [Actinomadura rudentiformis]|uniref:Uncharacterized protein n=1 Tax=Actinomadura rudentiformis TaxID=359158 RepID=A0A6H9YM06_9ACTN|nr:hypothetical protein [Actinomadura rudentiformis]KAB2340596.1 hypothetical protein F8566_44545 [Actinomadura rudentiformis]
MIVELSTRRVLCTVSDQAEIEPGYMYSYPKGSNAEEMEQAKYEDSRRHVVGAGSEKLERLLNSLQRGHFDLTS